MLPGTTPLMSSQSTKNVIDSKKGGGASIWDKEFGEQ